MTKDTAISFARTSISLGSVCLALLSISIPSSTSALLQVSLPIRILLSATGAILFLSAAFMLDWAIDLFSDKDWNELDERATSLGEKPFHAGRSFRARTRLFGGGYLLLSVGISVLVFAMLFLLIIHVGLSNKPLVVISILTSALCGVGVFVKMMTRRLGTVTVTIMLLGGLAFVSVVLNIILLLNP